MRFDAGAHLNYADHELAVPVRCASAVLHKGGTHGCDGAHIRPQHDTSRRPASVDALSVGDAIPGSSGATLICPGPLGGRLVSGRHQLCRDAEVHMSCEAPDAALCGGAEHCLAWPAMVLDKHPTN